VNFRFWDHLNGLLAVDLGRLGTYAAWANPTDVRPGIRRPPRPATCQNLCAETL